MRQGYALTSLISSLLWFSSPVFGEKAIAVNGLPFRKCESFVDNCLNYELDDHRKQEYRVLITKEVKDEEVRYFWETRERQKLTMIHKDDSVWWLFLADEGTGYIQIVKEPTSGRIFYMEHLVDAMQTITYWGNAIDFEP